MEGAAMRLFGVGGVSEQLAVLDVADGDPGDDDQDYSKRNGDQGLVLIEESGNSNYLFVH